MKVASPARKFDYRPALDLPAIDVIDKCHVEIVHGCQLRCVGCPNSTLQPKVKRIDPDDFDAYLRNIDVKHIAYLRLFNYGEPLLHRDLGSVLERIPRQNWSVGCVEISTNAQFADWTDLERAIRTRVLNNISVSCDGDGTPADYERLRPPSKWEKLVEFLDRAKALRDRHDPALVLMTRTVCTDPAGQARWRQLLEPRGWIPEFRGWLYLPESEQNLTGRAINVARGVCSFQTVHDRLYVDWDGTVVPCCAHPRAAVLGNLRDAKFSEILRTHTRADFLSRLATNRAAMPICNACEF
jgi:radical SAM protein with 4Fe4S-binding SPASM domain